MPRLPNPPRDGHPGKPPRRRGRGRSTASTTPPVPPRSYGQSAEMPKTPGGDLIDLEPDSIEDLAGEPMREDEDEQPR